MNPLPRRSGRLLAVCCLSLPALVAASAALAESLSGIVMDPAAHRPIEAATVRLLETGRAQRTDANGGFRFDRLAPGVYTLSAHHLAYSDLEFEVRVAPGSADAIAVPMHPAVYRTSEIVVRGTRSMAEVGTTPWAAEAAGAEQVRETPAVTISDAAARLPGLSLVRDGSWETALSIRGLGRGNVVALVDGNRIEAATDVSGALSLVNPLDLERIEVMKSSGSVLFGSGSLGGAVQMVTRRAAFSDESRFTGEWSDGVTSVDRGVAHYAALEHTGARHALRVSGGYRNAGSTRTGDGVLANSQYRDYSGTASLGLRTFGDQSLTTSYQRMQAEDTGIPGGAPFAAAAIARYPMARRELVALEYALPNLSRALPLVTARLSRQEIAREVELIQSPVVTVTPHATHTTTSGQLEARLAPGGEHLLVVGGELWHRGLVSKRERHLSAQHKIVGERPVPESAYMSGGVYAQDDWNVLPSRLRAVFGARYDKSRTHNDLTLNPDYVILNGVKQSPTPGQVVLWPSETSYDESWSANAGVRAALAPHVAASVLLATAFRSPSLEERYQFLDLGSSLHVGDPALKPERSVSLNAGAGLEFEHARLRLDAFGNQLTDLVTEIPGTFEGRTANVFVKANIGKARLYGFELSGEQRLVPGAAVLGSLAYVRGEDTFHHANLPQIAPLTGHAELDLDAATLGTLRVTCDAAHAQGNPAAGETVTSGWTAWGWNVTARPFPLGAVACRLRGGMSNAFDRAYRLHLSTLRGLVKSEAGRNAFLSASFTF